jgi:hypothetical protein
MATNLYGNGRSQVGTDVQVGTNLIGLVKDTPLRFFNHFVVYTKSSFAEQSIPAHRSIVDTVSQVTNLVFVDQDLDASQIGGIVSWNPDDESQLINYNVYFSENTIGTYRGLIGSAPNGTYSFTFAADVPKLSKSHIVVYTESQLTEQTTPTATYIIDRSSSVSAFAFADKDLDAGEIGGDVTWTAPIDISQVTLYSVYYAVSDNGVGRQLLETVPVSSYQPSIPTNTSLGTFTYFVAYTRSQLAEQTTPVSLPIHDSNGAVTALALFDADLDQGDIGGEVSWSPPADIAQVLTYTIYFSEDTAGSYRKHFSSVSVGINSIDVPADYDLAGSSYVVVYSASSEDEQTTPTALLVDDASASVSSLAFVDYDLDAVDLGGDVKWDPPGDFSRVAFYHAYLAKSSIGASRSEIGPDTDIKVGTNLIAVTLNTYAPLYTHVVVYTKSTLCEQVTPVSIPLVDADSSVSSVLFADHDLDLSDLGGIVSWAAPTDVSLVTYYTVYLASSAAGASKSRIGADPMGVPEGTLTISISADTPVGSQSHVVVFTRSPLAEQTTPAAISLIDISADVSGITFPDLDLDKTDIGGTLTWSEPGDISLVTHYVIYLAAGTTSGVSRSKLGSDIAVGTNTIVLLADVPLGSFTHFAIHTKSSLSPGGEQTTPGGTLEIVDRDGSVLNLNFGDRDYDVGQIGGDIKWTPPLDVAQVVDYSVYRAEDAAGTAKIQIGSTVAKGTNMVTLTVSTALGSYTHIVVYSSNSYGAQTTPAAVLIADTPAVGVDTTWTISNAESTTPLADGRVETAQVGLEWTVHELMFYYDSDCSMPVSGTLVSSGQTGQYHGPAEAFDGTIDTAWRAQCAPCAINEAFVGITVASFVRCVKWYQPPVKTGEGVRSVALQIGGTELARASGLKGGMWEGLQYGAAGGGWQMICGMAP